MKQVFETKLTVRLYSTTLIGKLNAIFQANPNRYQSRNQLLTELLELGVKEKLKELPVIQQSNNAGLSGEDTAILKQLKTLIEEMQIFNRQHIEGLLAHLKMSERMASAIYNILIAISTDEPISLTQVEKGYFDDIPLRFIVFLDGLLSVFSKDKSVDTEEEDEESLVDEGLNE